LRKIGIKTAERHHLQAV